MSHQLTFADSEFSTKRRQTRKEIFLSRMEQILPWQNMTAVIEPFYPKAGNGRRPYPLETMLRIHCMQHWYNLSDGAMEDALYEIASMRLFARLSLDSALPDRTTIMNFRHLLEQHQLARQLFKTINRWLAEAGVMMTKALWWMPPSLRHQLYQEQRAATRSGDASDQERQSVALWHEGPHWCRCQWPDPQPSHHRGQRA
ncbi:hypothetical protein ECZU51_37440 [Escherichia coli]|nr:hypothetical protein ECZU51_37440 [Escherichia coli]